MARANAAYYAARDPFADFTTSPEISQVFGEIMGLWAAVVWDWMGRPDPVTFAEAGPGRGTLMADALRTVGRTAPGFAAAARLHLIETSPRLRAIQAAALPRPAVWHDRVDDLPPGPLLLIANEFLDALPIRQFVRRGDGWTERHVVGGGFCERPAEGPDREALDGDIVEISDDIQSLATRIASRVVAGGGAALIVDYGYDRSASGETLQALRHGKPADPLDAPGSADLTAHVDFEALGRSARTAGAVVHGPVPQGLFLARLGLFQRTDRLARGQPPRQGAALIDAARRLAEPDRMGRLFKAMAFCHPSLPIPPGFEPEPPAS